MIWKERSLAAKCILIDSLSLTRHILDLTVSPVPTPGEADRLARAVQLDGNFQEDPYDVFIDQVSFVRKPGLGVTKQAEPVPVQPSSPLTYTIRVTNTGNITRNAIITDILPHWVTRTGVLTWTAVVPAPSVVWTETVVVTAQLSACELVNRVQVAQGEGAMGDYTETSAVDADYIYLPALFRNYDPRLIEVSGILHVGDACALCCYYVGLETTNEFYELATFLGRQYDGLYVKVGGLLEGPCTVSYRPVIRVISIEVLEPLP